MSKATAKYEYSRKLLGLQPVVGFWVLSSVYGIASSFFIANFYSWGLYRSFLLISFPIFFLSSLLGAAVIHIDASILRYTARLFGMGRASIVDLKLAIASSKVPLFLSLMMWILLSVSDPSTVFVHYATSSSAAMIVFISLILNLWSFGLLVQAFRELQRVSLIRAFLSNIVSLFFSFLFYIAMLFIGRYVYISCL